MGKLAYIPIAIILISVCFFEKEHIVSEKGINIRYKLFGITMNNYWKWEDITVIQTDYKKAEPNVMIYFGKDINTRLFVMTEKDCNGVLKLAKTMNQKIHFEDKK
jgi:hypothetical protein